MGHDGQRPKSLCILRLSSIGDVCHAAAMAQAVRKALPELSITWVVGSVEHRLLRGLPGVDFVVFDKSAGLAGFLELRRAMAGRRFDVLFHMQRAFRASLVSLFIDARRRIGWDRARARELQWLFTNERVSPQERPHVIDGFFAFAAALGVERGELEWNIPIPEEDRRWACARLPGETPVFAVNPSASDSRRNWTPEGYAEVAGHVHARHGWTVVLTGGPGRTESEFAEAVAGLCSFPVINLVGQTSLKQLLAVLERCDLLLAPDTGPLHMAGTVGTRVVGLYGHSNPARTGPLHHDDVVVSRYEEALEAEYGKDSSRLPWGTRARGRDVMKSITVSEVVEAVERAVGRLGRRTVERPEGRCGGGERK